jgi:hypothetical protein
LGNAHACKGHVAKMPHGFGVAMACCFLEFGSRTQIVFRAQGIEAALAGT